MTDIPIPDIAEDFVEPTTNADLERVSERFSGLADDELMRRAWS